MYRTYASFAQMLEAIRVPQYVLHEKFFDAMSRIESSTVGQNDRSITVPRISSQRLARCIVDTKIPWNRSGSLISSAKVQLVYTCRLNRSVFSRVQTLQLRSACLLSTVKHKEKKYSNMVLDSMHH